MSDPDLPSAIPPTLPDDDDVEQVLIVGDAEQGQRLDVFLASRLADISRSQLQRLIDTQAVQLNGDRARSSNRVQSGDLVLVAVPPPRLSHILPQAIPLEIVFEDSDVIVINKPKGMVVHPAPGAEDGTLVNALLAHGSDLSGIGGVIRPGIVHRLDKDTSGLLMVAKNDLSHQSLQKQIQARTAKRMYLALVWGRPPFDEAIVDVPIGRHPTDRKRMTVIDPASGLVSRSAVTELRVLERIGPFSLLECTLQTGRTHQIRVHAAFAGFPVVGDPVYGSPRKIGADMLRGPALQQLNERLQGLHGQALHAYSLSFDHPTTSERLTFLVPPPPEMQELIDFLQELPEFAK
jgi:23S rRNA pseudouridine1911/1915/1917 synthase